MAEIVATIALSHAPGLTGWLDQATDEEQKSLTEGFTALGRFLRDTKPDVIVGIANDHVLNIPLSSGTNFCVGTAADWSGPAEWFKDWLKVPDYALKGHREMARTIVGGLDGGGISVSFTDELLFDDNWSVPLYFLTPDYDIPLVPIHMNCIVPPIPTPETCYAFGQAVAQVIREQRPAGERVALMGTGGLSHDPGGPKYFQVDEEFDRWFLGLLEEGDPDKVLREATIERMAAAGEGGTTELLAWIAVMGAAGGGPARTICYEPAVALRCGMGCVVWDQQ